MEDTGGESEQHPAATPIAGRERLAVVASLLALLGVVVGTQLADDPAPRSRPSARASGAAGTYVLSPEQAANATTIAAVGKRLGLPDHAVSVALAASLQESGLHNLAGGDRDSIGLFQQRPSQGWGTPSQIADPTYAATAFYDHLAQVPDWASRSVTDAAQAVQHSAAPSAYATWEPEARTLAAAFTGEVGGRVHLPLRAVGRRAAALGDGRGDVARARRSPRWPRPSMRRGDGWWRAGWSATPSSTASTQSASTGSAGRRGSGAWEPRPPAVARVQV